MMLDKIALFALFAAALGTFVSGTVSPRSVSTPPINTPNLLGPIPQASFAPQQFRIILTDTPEKQARGLSGRKSLPEDAVMLFKFSKEDRHGIWMKDMYFPIDIVWLDESMVVVDIKPSADPSSYPTIFRPKSSARFVVEGNAGFVKEYEIKIGNSFPF